MLKQTPLHDIHETLGARMVDFAGWHMPLFYSSIPDEVAAVRKRVGLFDLTHMGRLVIGGPQRDDAVQRLISNDVERIKPGAIRYALLCDGDGHVLDDTLVYNDAENEQWHVVVNAANRDADFAHAQAVLAEFDATIANVSEDQAMLALQGPASMALLSKLTTIDLTGLGYYKLVWGDVNDVHTFLSRTGYTGEDGFELFFPKSDAETMWRALTDAGADLGVAPIGLGARDVLRTEAAMPLYGQEIDATRNPLEAGLGWGVRLDSGFLGAEAIRAQKEAGLTSKLVGLTSPKGRVPRPGYALLVEGNTVGVVTSGTYSPTLEKNIAMGYLPVECAEPGQVVQIDVRGKSLDAEIVELPFYKRAK